MVSMNLGHLLRRIKRKYREEGVRQLFGDGVAFAKRGFRIRSYQSTRVDIEDRWELLHPLVENDDKTLLDIGCAEGKLTYKFSETGIFSIGIDRQPDALQLARKKYGLSDGLGFARYLTSPSSIDGLPAFDIVLLLTVYHHWIEEFGVESSEQMLAELGKTSQKIFFEIPNRDIGTEFKEISDDVKYSDYYQQYLESIFPDSARIGYLGKTSYRGNEREDILYFIDCSRVD